MSVKTVCEITRSRTLLDEYLKPLIRNGVILVLRELRDFFQLKALAELIDKVDVDEKSCNGTKLMVEQIQSLGAIISTLISDLIFYGNKRCITKFYHYISLPVFEESNPPRFSDHNVVLPSSTTELKRLQARNNDLESLLMETMLKEIIICDKSSDYYISKGYENAYRAKSNDAKIEFCQYYCDLRVQKLNDEKALYLNAIVSEEFWLESQKNFLYNNIENIKKKIELVEQEHDKTREKLDEELHFMSTNFKSICQQYNDAIELLNSHKEWVKLQRQIDAVIIIQRYWRRILAIRRAAERELKTVKNKKSLKKIRIVNRQIVKK